ncbi:MAG: SUMF1/EgtB/PvdO family nonheme iron enzyme, partial [Deltaproteobacteria bacterium]|nr:SUMF1/EgtB/PvdO family nonheme iron enzyme [Deltaproteobacteria bacterium]
MSSLKIWIICFVGLMQAGSGCTGLDTSGKDKCTSDSDCLDGKICQDGLCQARSCTSNDDCQAPAPLCDESEGQCVQCLNQSDCSANQECSGGLCVGESCQTDDQCERGQICEEGDCLSGCRSERDCYDGWKCIVDSGPHGMCVECLVQQDCQAGYTCKDNLCVTDCTDDSHCAPRVCDLATHECVDCLVDEDCSDQATICISKSCVAGCRDDEDCPDGRCNDSNECVECLSDNDCPTGTICLDGCETGCFSSRDCPGELLCDTEMGDHGACVECLVNADCETGYLCREGSCAFFCESDQDCSVPLPACDQQGGTCVACVDNSHCSNGTICADFACTPGCQNNSDCPAGKLCDQNLGDYGGCVDCLINDDCGAGQICQYSQCILEGNQMVRIQGGAFFRGSDPGEGDGDEEPEKTITLPTFYIDRTETTNSQYKDCVHAGDCTEPVETQAYNDPATANHPVVYVSWQQAQDYCEWQGKTLPSEARWERAARGITPSEATYPWGDQAPNCSQAEFSGCSGGTSAVGAHLSGASSEGVLDMAGNVWEWVYDYYDSDYYNQGSTTDDPSGPESGNTRVTRGGAYDSLAEQIRCANRTSYPPEQVSPNRGFRCSMEGGPTAEFSVSPEVALYTEYFEVDASGCSDPNYSVDVLEVRWDWDDVSLPTEWTREKTASRRYIYPGIFNIELQVRNPDGYVDSQTHQVVAEGEWGWDGTPCETSAECAHGFVCITQLDVYEYLCRQ